MYQSHTIEPLSISLLGWSQLDWTYESIPEDDISDIPLGLYIWCICDSFISGFNIQIVRKTLNSSSWRNDLNNMRKRKLEIFFIALNSIKQ